MKKVIFLIAGMCFLSLTAVIHEEDVSDDEIETALSDLKAGSSSQQDLASHDLAQINALATTARDDFAYLEKSVDALQTSVTLMSNQLASIKTQIREQRIALETQRQYYKNQIDDLNKRLAAAHRESENLKRELVEKTNLLPAHDHVQDQSLEADLEL